MDYNEILLNAIETVVDAKVATLEKALESHQAVIGTITDISDEGDITVVSGTHTYSKVQVFDDKEYQVDQQVYLMVSGEIRYIIGRAISDTEKEQNTAFYKTFFEVTSETLENSDSFETEDSITYKKSLEGFSSYLWNTIQLEADFQCVTDYTGGSYGLATLISLDDGTTKIALDLRSQEMLGNPFGFVLPSRQKAFTQVDSSLLNKKISSIEFVWKNEVPEEWVEDGKTYKTVINPTVTNIKLSFGYYEEDFGNDQVEIDAIGGAGYPIYNEKGEELANTLRARWYNRSDHAKLVWNNGAEGEICTFSPSFMKTEEEVSVKVEKVPYQATSTGEVVDKKVTAIFTNQKEFEEAKKAFEDKKSVPNVISVKFTNERSSDDAKKDENGNIKNPLETIVFKNGEDSFEVSISNDYTWDAGATRIFEILLGAEDKYSVITYQTDKPLGSASIILKNEKIINDAAKNLGWNVDIVNKENGHALDTYSGYYDYDNKMIDDHQRWLQRYVELSPYGDNLPKDWYIGSTITWMLPAPKNSMIYPQSFSGAGSESEVGYKVTHQVNSEDDYKTAMYLAYRIKEVYNPKLNDNTITCDITLRNEKVGELESLGGGTIRATKSIGFENGKASGTYTLAVYPQRKMCAFTSSEEKSWIFKAELFDKNGNIITDKAKDFTWVLNPYKESPLKLECATMIEINASGKMTKPASLVLTENESYRVKATEEVKNIESLIIEDTIVSLKEKMSWKKNESKLFRISKDEETWIAKIDEEVYQTIKTAIDPNAYNILEVTVDKNVISWAGAEIKTTYPMTFCNANKLIHASVPIYVTYNGAGLLERQFDPINAYLGNNKNSACYWILCNSRLGETEGPVSIKGSEWHDDWKETGYSGYVKRATLNDDIHLTVSQDYSYPDDYRPYIVLYWTGLPGPVWSSPFIIRQNRYGSEILNNWDGGTVIDDRYILSAAAAFGKKNSKNEYSGVILGEVGKIAGETKTIKTGLLGYHEGVQSFGFNTDGTAFLGKPGAGRIEFNGDQGIIASSSWFDQITGQLKADDSTLGIKIDLEKGYLYANQDKGNYLHFDESGLKISGDITMITGKITWGENGVKAPEIDEIDGLSKQISTINQLATDASTKAVQAETKADEASKTADGANQSFINLDTKVTNYLTGGGTTALGSNYVISPYIGGGYLHITNGNTSVTINPGEISPTGLNVPTDVFKIMSNGTAVVKIDNSGNASFSGHITATSGQIGGWQIINTYLLGSTKRANNKEVWKGIALDSNPDHMIENANRAGRYYSVFAVGQLGENANVSSAEGAIGGDWSKANFQILANGATLFGGKLMFDETGLNKIDGVGSNNYYSKTPIIEWSNSYGRIIKADYMQSGYLYTDTLVFDSLQISGVKYTLSLSQVGISNKYEVQLVKQ